VRPRSALLPLEGFPASRLPTWPDAVVKVLAAPALGAQFAQYLIELPAGRHTLELRPFGTEAPRRVAVDVPSGGTARVSVPVSR
jgi:glyoxylate utilization-related uncharacterized protein